jgi:probable F420-dependent oxidoreductase
MADDLPDLGFGLPVSGSWAVPDNMETIARRAEEAGYHSLWTFQRLLYPSDSPMGPMYESVHDPLVPLAYAAALTRRPRLGIAIVNAPFYSPVGLAKQLTTLDVLSHGRLDAGLGLGWVEEEFIATGVDSTRRGARLDEFVRCLRSIWSDDPVEFSGEFYRVPRSAIDPKPVQRPHPPILLGGSAPAALRRVGRVADGWITRSRHDLRSMPDDVRVIREAAAEAGRDADAVRIIVRGVLSVSQTGADDLVDRRPLHGTVGQIHGDLARLRSQGVTEVFLDLNFDPQIGNPRADAAESLRRALSILDTFAPG